MGVKKNLRSPVDLKKGAFMKERTLRAQLVRFLMMGWFLPMLVMLLAAYWASVSRISSQTEKMVTTSVEKAAEISSMQIESCITDSKAISYLSDLRNIRETYEADGDRGKLYKGVMTILEQQYKFSASYDIAVLYFTDMPNVLYYTGSDRRGGSGARFQTYRKLVHEIVLEKSETLDTKTKMISAGGGLYLIRNVMDHDFKPYAVIVLQLDTDAVLESLQGITGITSVSVWDGDYMLFTSGNGSEKRFEQTESKTEFADHGSSIIVSHTRKVGDQKLQYVVTCDPNALNMDRKTIIWIYSVFLLLIGPLFAIILYFINTRITRPISLLSKASKTIASGKFGVTVEESRGSEPGGEIHELTSNFNAMSRKLDEQFNRIYKEELALRDANIHALQSQITPHFLNNTLEIINWEVRMNGDEKAGEMLEALSVMLSATMDRKREPFITLQEEMEYVKAYLVIIGYRYGDRFTYEEEIDQDLLQTKVPRLIIQPVIENAVEHGTDEEGCCSVKLSVSGTDDRTGTNVTISIRNKGCPTKEDLEKIEVLLNGSEEEVAHAHSTSIGIRNVNRRLKMMYGEDSGLTIKVTQEGDTLSTLRMKKGEANV